MLIFLTILTLLSFGLSATSLPARLNQQIEGRIVGGENTTINSHPWLVSVQRNGQHYCGGVIYNQRVIVTTAFCLNGATMYNTRVRAGSTTWNSGGTLSTVSAAWAHELYNYNSKMYDIAVMRLTQNLTYSSTIKALPLATAMPANGTSAIISGWGSTSFESSSAYPTILQQANVSLITRTVCSSQPYGYGNAVGSTMVCAAGPGRFACNGDIGGPLVANGSLIGVVSWGNYCSDWRYPSVLSNVPLLRTWIENAANYI